MSVKRRLAILCGAVTVAVATLMAASPASVAAPDQGLRFTVTCPGLGTFEVTTPSAEAPFTPAFAAATHQVFIPYEVTGEVTVDGQVVEQFSDIKPAPVPADAITCTFTATFTVDGQTVTVSGTVLVAMRGQP
jgi:hypothetical protein